MLHDRLCHLVKVKAPSLSRWLTQHVILASLLVLVCSIAPRLLFTALADPRELLFPDSYTYLSPAHKLISVGAFVNSDNAPEVSRTPGYPAFLAGIMLLVGRDWGGADLGKILYAQTIITSWYVVFLYWLARRILPPVAAFMGALLAAFSPWGVVLAGRALTEGLFIGVLALIFLLIKLIQETSEIWRAVSWSAIVGLFTGSAVLIRPLWPLLVLIAGALFIQYGPRKKGAWLVLTVMITTASLPLLLWTARNVQEVGIYGLTDHGGKAAWQYLASRVESIITGEDRFSLVETKMLDEESWNLSVREADQERWRRAKGVFLHHPFLTLYSFTISAVEHMIHPSPDILMSAGFNFYGDYWALTLLWLLGMMLAYIGWRCKTAPKWDHGRIDHGWLLTLLVVCGSLTYVTGVGFGAGSRYRAPLELIVPLLAAIGLQHVTRSVFEQRSEICVVDEPPITNSVSSSTSTMLRLRKW